MKREQITYHSISKIFSLITSLKQEEVTHPVILTSVIFLFLFYLVSIINLQSVFRCSPSSPDVYDNKANNKHYDENGNKNEWPPIHQCWLRIIIRKKRSAPQHTFPWWQRWRKYLGVKPFLNTFALFAELFKVKLESMGI